MLNYQQKELTKEIEIFCKGTGIFTILGAGGVGKTYTVCHLDFSDEIYFLAPTHKAKSILFKNLKENGLKEINIDTTSKFFGWSKEKDENNKDVVTYDSKTLDELISKKSKFIPKAFVIDEISMIKSDEVELIEYLSKYFPVILLGDGFQIPPVKETKLHALKIKGKDFEVSNIFKNYFNSKNGYKLTNQVRQNKDSNLFNLINSFRNKIVDSIQYEYNLKSFVNGKDILWMDPYSNEFINFVKENDSVAVSYTNQTGNFFNYLIGKYISGEDKYYMNRFHKDENIVFNRYYKNLFESNEEEDFFNPKYKDGISKHTQSRMNIENDFEERFAIIEYKGHKITEGVMRWNSGICFGNPKMQKDVKQFVNEQKKVLINVNRKHLYNWYDKFKSSIASVSKTYGITAHKSQGSSFENVIIPVQDFEVMLNFSEHTAINRILYVALSRASKRIIFVDFKYDWGKLNFNQHKKDFIASRQDFKCAQTDNYLKDFKVIKNNNELIAIINYKGS